MKAQMPKSKINFWLMTTASCFALGGSYFIGRSMIATESWFLTLPLLLFYGLCLMSFRIKKDKAIGTFVALQLGVVTGLAFFTQHMTMLYMVIALCAVINLPIRAAINWVLSCAACVFAVHFFAATNPLHLQDAVVNSLLTCFIGGLALLLKKTELQNQLMSDLLQQLEDKNQQLAEFAEEKAIRSRIEERHSLSRELHDTLGHKLTVSVVQLEAAAKLIHSDPDRVANVIDTVRTLLKKGLDETRDMVKLVGRNAKEMEFSEEIKRLIVDFTAAVNIQAEISHWEEKDFPQLYRQHLYRIIQESLTNISKHAQAENIFISLFTTDEVELIIQDDGKSLKDKDVLALPPLKSIESRVEELGGQTVFKRDKGLTTLKVTLPIC